MLILKLRRRAAVWLALPVLSFAAGSAHAQAVPGDYRLHAGDKLEVSVWKETEMQKPGIIVRPDGKFAFPWPAKSPQVGRQLPRCAWKSRTA